MSERKFLSGDRIIVSDTPVESADKVFSGMVGNVDRYTHTVRGREVYRVTLDEDGYSHAFYGEDLLLHGELDALRVELAKAEAKVVTLKEAIKLKERDGADLPVGTVVTAKGEYGPSVMTKQAENAWLNVFTLHDGAPRTAVLTDERITDYLAFDLYAEIRKP